MKTIIVGSVLLVLTLGSGALLANWLFAGAPQQTEEGARPDTRDKATGHEKKQGKHGGKEEAKHAGKGAKKQSKPEGKHTEKETKKPHGEKDPNHAEEHPPPETAEPVAYLGGGRARLGDFSIKLFDSVTRNMLRADFHLEGVIACDDETAFQGFLASSLHFFREQILIAVRSSDVVDFTDPQLQVLRRRMIARVNRAFGCEFLRSVEVKDLAVYESIDNSPYVRWQPAAPHNP